MTHTNSAKNRATVTFHTSPENRARLEKLASATKRSRSYISNEALERYLKEEESFIASVERGLADLEAGKVRSSDEVRAHLAKVSTQCRK